VGRRPQTLVQARFSPNPRENPVAGESGPTPPEFRGRMLRHRRAGPPVRDIAILYLGWSFRPSLTGRTAVLADRAEPGTAVPLRARRRV